MALLDYAATLRAGQSLVPDFRLQAMQDEQMAFQREQMQMQRDQMERQRAAEQREREQAEGFQRDMTQAMAQGGDPDSITGLMFRYPKQFEQHKAAFDRLEKDQQQTELTQMGSIYSRLTNGDANGAATILRRRVDADREAGQEDPIDTQILAALESGDPREIAIAKTMIGTQVAALGGVDTFKAVYGGGDAESRTSFQKDYDFIAATYGQEAADQYAQAEYDPTVVGQPGAPIYRQSQISGRAPAPASMRGGDPSGSGGLVATRGQEVGSAQLAKEFGMEGVTVDDKTGDVYYPNGHVGNLDRMLAITVQSESGGDPNAVSPKGAKGLMQVMPATGRAPGYGVRPSNGSPVDDVRLGQDYFAAMLRKYRDPAKAWAAYNAGPGALDRALGSGENWLSQLPAETRAYVAKNMRALGDSGTERIASKQQYDRLPSGAEYIAPDGSRRRKP